MNPIIKVASELLKHGVPATQVLEALLETSIKLYRNGIKAEGELPSKDQFLRACGLVYDRDQIDVQQQYNQPIATGSNEKEEAVSDPEADRSVETEGRDTTPSEGATTAEEPIPAGEKKTRSRKARSKKVGSRGRAKSQ